MPRQPGSQLGHAGVAAGHEHPAHRPSVEVDLQRLDAHVAPVQQRLQGTTRRVGMGLCALRRIDAGEPHAVRPLPGAAHQQGIAVVDLQHARLEEGRRLLRRCGVHGRGRCSAHIGGLGR